MDTENQICMSKRRRCHDFIWFLCLYCHFILRLYKYWHMTCTHRTCNTESTVWSFSLHSSTVCLQNSMKRPWRSSQPICSVSCRHTMWRYVEIARSVDSKSLKSQFHNKFPKGWISEPRKRTLAPKSVFHVFQRFLDLTSHRHPTWELMDNISSESDSRRSSTSVRCFTHDAERLQNTSKHRKSTVS